MANHGYVRNCRNLTPEAFKAALDEINARRFQGKLVIEPAEAYSKHGFLVHVSTAHQLQGFFCRHVRGIHRKDNKDLLKLDPSLAPLLGR